LSSKNCLPTEEFLQIQIAIELDQGREMSEIVSEFGVTLAQVRKIAKNAGLLKSGKQVSSRKRLSNDEKEFLMRRIEEGDDPEELAFSVGLKSSTLLGWCRIHGILVPRNFEQISMKERMEIRLMLEEYPWQEVAKAYRLNHEAIEELREPAYRKLDSSVLAFLYELFKENPKITASKVLESSITLDIEVNQEELESYRKRLIEMKRI
jgi:hypothetical protein